MNTSPKSSGSRTLMMKSGRRRSRKVESNTGTATATSYGDIIRFGIQPSKNALVTYSISIRSKLIRALGCATFVLSTAPWSLAQLEQPDRYEIRLANNEPAFHVTSVSSKGLVLHRFVRSN